MHLTNLLRDGPFHTFEFFPPRTDAGTANLLDRVQRLAEAPLRRPVAVSVTWGAGGATADKSLELAEQITKLGLEVVLHLTCTNMPKEKVDMALRKARAIGITNVLALRGDPPRTDEYSTSDAPLPDIFRHADDLIRYIREEHGDHFCIGVAGYPTPHPDSADEADEMRWLKVKCDAGAQFIITQLFYDVDGFERWVARCRDAGIHQVIIPGIMPIQNFASFRRLVKLTRCEVPSSILADLEPIKADDAAIKRYGAELATRMVDRLISRGTVQGVHFCTLNLEKSVRTIMEALGWVTAPSPRHRNKVIEDHAVDGLTVSAEDAAQWGLAAKKDDTWDEYPNGRFTDVRSPAYGEIDGWGSGLKNPTSYEITEWGTPTTHNDLAALFTAYLRGQTPTTPFCDLPLSPESQTILPTLLRLNEMRYYTVGSQPAVDAASSDDPVHGWGPKGGYVFQKPFVEFFVPASEVEKLEDRLMQLGGDGITMYAANKLGEFRTNAQRDAVNAVTWGVFPGQEIVQSTIIEQTSFLAWKEEAFEIWSDWAQLYPRESASRRLIEGVGEWWLVSVIGHDYKDTQGLWRFLGTRD